MHRTFAFVATLLACALVTGPVRAQADRARTIAELHKQNPPIVFFIAHGEPNSCGAGCDSWIAAEGRIDEDAPLHLRRVLEQAGKRKLPIYFQSPGGNMREAMEIGRMLRSRGLTAGVARTLPQGCWPAKAVDVCSKAMQEKPSETAVLAATGASCLSACPFALIGATTRLIEPTTLVGVHEGLTYFTRTNGIAGRRLELALEKLESKWDGEYSRYIAEMGIDKGLFTVVKETPWAKMHYLTRAELIAFGIDRREVLLASSWNIDVIDPASIGYAAYTSVTVRLKTQVDAVPTDHPKPMTLALSCTGRPRGDYLLTSLQPVANTSVRSGPDFVLKADRSSILLTRASSFLTTNKNEVLEVRRAHVWRALLDALLTASAVTISGDVPWAVALAHPESSGAIAVGPYAQATISTLGAADALKALVARCEPSTGAQSAGVQPASPKN